MIGCLDVTNNHKLLYNFFRSESWLYTDINRPFVLIKLEVNLSVLEYLEFDSFLSMSQTNFS